MKLKTQPKYDSRLMVGFSLIELVIVILLLGIVSSAALPRFTTYRTAADTEAQNALYQQVQANFNKLMAAGDGAPYDTNSPNKTVAFNTIWLSFGGMGVGSPPMAMGTTKAEAQTNANNGVIIPTSATNCALLWNAMMNINPLGGHGSRYTAGTIVDDGTNCGTKVCDFVANYVYSAEGQKYCSYQQVASPVQNGGSYTYSTTGLELDIYFPTGVLTQTTNAPVVLVP